MRRIFRNCGFVSGFLIASAAAASAQVMIWQPPAALDHPFRGQVVEHRASWQETRTQCDRIVGSGVSLSGFHDRPDACQWWIGRTCHIAIPVGQDVTPEETAQYRHHETAHCSGWDEDHAGGF
jgi:hypothetical protein